VALGSGYAASLADSFVQPAVQHRLVQRAQLHYNQLLHCACIHACVDVVVFCATFAQYFDAAALQYISCHQQFWLGPLQRVHDAIRHGDVASTSISARLSSLLQPRLLLIFTKKGRFTTTCDARQTRRMRVLLSSAYHGRSF
jgi:hypothetical protein